MSEGLPADVVAMERRLGEWQRGEIPVDVVLCEVERIMTEREAAARADEREWFRSALTSDMGDLLDVDWLREYWWVKHVVATHLDGPDQYRDYPPAQSGGSPT